MSMLDDLDDLGSDVEGNNSYSGAAGNNGVLSSPLSNDNDRETKQNGKSYTDDIDELIEEDEREVIKAGGDDEMEEIIEKELRDDELEMQLNSTITTSSGLHAIARIRSTQRYISHMAAVDEALSYDAPQEIFGSVEEWPEYILVVNSNSILQVIDNEIFLLHKLLIDTYGPHFPELAGIISAPMDYARVAKMIQNDRDLSNKDLELIVSPAISMVLGVSSSSSSGIALAPETLAEANEIIAEMEGLESGRNRIIKFIESRMEVLAPNLTTLLDARPAALLLSLVGGLNALNSMPAGNIQVIGLKKKQQTGMSNVSSLPAGVIAQAPWLSACPQSLLRRATRVLGPKVALCARADVHGSRSSMLGKKLKDDILKKIEDWQYGTIGAGEKVLPVPDEQRKKKRGGAKARALKKRLGITATAKEAGRLAFEGGGDYDSVAMGTDSGMLGTGVGVSGGRLKIQSNDSRKKKSDNNSMKAKVGPYSNTAMGSKHGSISTFNFTPVQGIELVNPVKKRKLGEESVYFNPSN